ncbi:MAG: type II glyceraldehyde-3-phosphate dehydrogenase [Thermoplasmata archaeon]
MAKRIRVGVNGYGTIGKRVADAVARQPDLELIGVAKTRPSFEAAEALRRGYRLFVSGNGDRAAFQNAGLAVAGTLDDLLSEVDVVVDAAPDKVGRENAALYRAKGVRAIFQGGEKAEVAQASFTALANYAVGHDKHSLRVVSCNTTGLARAAAVIDRAWGVDSWEATIVRRAADPAESKKGPINGILPTFQMPSHHGPDVRTVLQDLPISTLAVVVPTTLMHVHVNRVRLRHPPAHVGEVVARLAQSPRFRIVRGWERMEGTPQIMEYARDRGLGHTDVMENVLWEEGIGLSGPDLHFFQAIHQESIVVPENIDAIRSMFGLAPNAEASMALTDRTLGLAPAEGARAPAP